MRKYLATLALALIATAFAGCCCPDDKPNPCNGCYVEPTIREGGHGWR